jgi:hypothetical protein
MATKKYKSPIREKRKVIFVYASPKNHKWIKSLPVLSASEFVNRMLTLMREEHDDFKNLPAAVEGRPQNAKAQKFTTPFDPEVKDAG